MTRQKRHRDTAELIGWARRAIRAAGNCVAHRGLETGDDLGMLAALQAELDAALVAAVAGSRRHGHSWQEIADSLGVTRQYAHRTYAPAVDLVASA